tara:strand:- start:2283 stop:2621 length:339 start_codon:yes stop_codon:yes gene_type:complete
MRILVDEEYGYRYWVWTPKQETVEDLLEYMTTIDEEFFDKWVFLHPSNLMGVWKQLILPVNAIKIEDDWYYDQVLNPSNYDGAGYFHTFNDSHITLNGKEYEFSKFGNTSRV